MKRSKGQRVRTRSILRRRKSERSRLNISRVMHDYEAGDRVAIVLDGGQQMGMPCLLYTSPSPRDATLSRMPSSA